MPIYEYQGQQYDIATNDPAAAKAKILNYLGTQAPAPAQKTAPVASKPTQTASDDFDFGSPMGTGAEEIMAAAKPAPTKPVATKEAAPAKREPYKNRVEMLDDAVNLLEEGVDRDEMKQSLQKMGVKWDDVVKHGQQRGSAYFKQQAPMPTPAPAARAKPAGEIKAIPETEFTSAPFDWTAEAISNTFKRVNASLGDAATSYLFQTGVSDADAAGRLLARNAKQRAAAAPSQSIREGMEEIGNAETYGDAISALASNPRATFTMLVESLAVSMPGMIPSLVLGPAGVVARSSAAGLSSGALEYGSVMADVLQDKGVNMLDPNAISKALSNPKIMEEIKEKGAKRGLIVGAFDALSMGMAGRFLKPAQALIAEGKLAGTAAKKATMAAWGKELATQMAGGAGGEFAAQKATGENKPADVLLEALAEGFTAPLEARANLREARMAEQEAAINAELAAGKKEEPLSTAGKADQIRADKIAALTEVLEKQGIPTDNAERIATRKVDAELKAEAKAAAIKVPKGRVEQITQDLIAAGVNPQQAKLDAQAIAEEEAQADELAQTEAGGVANVARPISEPSGEGVSVAGQPSAEPPAGGVVGAEPSGVVSTGQTVAGTPAGETVEPTALEEKADEGWKDLGQVQRYEEPGVGRATTDKPHGIYTTPANVESPHKDLGGERSTWNVNQDANVLDVTPLAGPDVAMRKSAVGAGAGVAAAKKLLGAERFETLRRMSREELIAEAKAQFPNVDFSKYYDAQEVMEALGAQLAKQAGYDAIWQADKDPAFSEFVALTDNAMTPTETKAQPTLEEQAKAEEELDKKSREEASSLSFDELRTKTKEGASAPGKIYTAAYDETETDEEGNRVSTRVSTEYKVVRMDGGWTVVSSVEGKDPVLFPPSRAAANTDEQLVEQRNNEAQVVTNTKVKPAETKGAKVGTETPEAVEATQEGQEAPAAGAVTKGKRGRPPVQQAHVVVENPEGGFDHVTNGEVTATYTNKKQATAAVNLAKAKDKGDTAKIAKFQAELDKALTSTGRGRPAKAPSEEGVEDLSREDKVELDALESALETYNSPASDTSIKNAAMYIYEVANDKTAPKAVRERAQQMLEDDVDPKDVQRALRSSEAKVGKADTGFSKLTNGSQAIAHIIKTGNMFQRFVAQRIRNFVTNVKFVVVEKGDATPANILKELAGARGLFVYTPGSKERTVYVRGASFGNQQGINVITVLHELLHAATASRIEAGLLKGFRNASLQKFLRELDGIMKRAEQEYKDLAYLDMLDENVNDIVSKTYDPKTDSYEIFSNPHEFLAYGMSSPEFQKFLMRVKGVRKETSLFSRFTNSIRDLFGINEGEATAFSDLVDITDKMLGTRLTAVETGRTSLQQKGKFTPPEFDEQADIRAKRSALELERDARKAKQNVANSREGDMATAVEAMQKERDPSKVRQILANAWSWADYKQRELMVRQPTFDFLAKWAAEKGISALTQTNTYLERMLGMSQQFLAGAEQIVGMLDRGFKEDPKLSRKAFEDFVYATTIAEIDPSDPNAVERSITLDNDYAALGPVGQRMYKQLRDYYESIIELYSDLLDDQIQNAQGLSQAEKTNLMALLRKTFEAKARIRPYFPLVRRGDFWLAIGSGEKRRFYTFESRIDRNNKAAELAAGKGDDVEDLLFRQEFVQGNDLGSLRTASKDSSQMLKQTFDAIDKMEMGEDSAGAKEGLKDAVYQIYLNTMPEQTFRKQFTHRKNRMGFSTDVRQNVATTAAKQATQLSRLKYAPLLRVSLSSARDSIREQEELSPFVQEAERRVNLALSGTGGGIGESIAGVANKASFFWFLSGASSALIQPSSIFISGLPVLAGNYGSPTKAGLELAKMATLVNQYSILRTNSDGTTSISAPSIANNKSLPEDERRAVSEMVSRGVSQSTYASMVWGYKQTPTESMYFSMDKGWGNIPVAYGKGKRLANFLVGALMHNTERLSREAVYLAAYRLGKKQGLSYGDAVQKAVDSTNEALGNYDITNKPRYMQQGIGKVAFQFKMYPLQMTLLMLTNFKRMLPFLNKEGKKAAATKFFGMMGSSALLAGVSNMALFSPIMGLIGWAWGQMRGDDDWPDELKDVDFQTWFRTVFLPEKLGDVTVGGVPVSDLIDRGPLNAITDYDIASRIGLNDLWGRDSKETKTSRDSAIAFMLDHFAGPTASLLLGFADAYDAYAMGDYQKMREKLAPAAVRNLMVANKYADEGMKTGRGVELVGKEDVKTGELIGQAIGFRPDILAATQGPAFKLTGVEQRINNQRNLLLNKLDFQLRKDTNEGDEKFDKILEDEVAKFNAKYPSYALDGDAIVNSLLKKAEQRATSRAGVIATEKNIPLIEEATDVMEKRLDRRAAEMAAKRKAEKNPR